MSETEKVISVVSFITQVEAYKKSIKKDFLIYRGQASSDWELIPKIGRYASQLDEDEKQSFYSLERRINEDFRRWIPSFMTNFPDDELNLICLGQHYGLYTRLLDWSQNPLVALWFAINDKQHDYSESDSSVWILGHDHEDVLDWSKTINLNKLKRTSVVYPRFNDKRISSQSSIFTLHSINIDGNFIPVARNKYFKGNLKEIIIDRDSVSNLRKELSQFVSSFSIFQDLGSLCEDINKRHDPALANLFFGF